MSILLTLSKKHDTWLAMALKITKNKELAKDLVQDMYVRIGMAKPQPTKLTEGYIFATLKNLDRDDVKKNTTYVSNKEKYKVYFVDLDDNKYKYDITTEKKLVRIENN